MKTKLTQQALTPISENDVLLPTDLHAMKKKAVKNSYAQHLKSSKILNTWLRWKQ